MKRKIKFLSILISLSLALNSTGCRNSDEEIINDNKRKSEYLSAVSNESSILEESSIKYDNLQEFVSPLNDEEKKDITNQYLDYFNNIVYVYRGSEFYLSEDEIKELIRKSNTIQECSNNDVSMDIDEVVGIIKNNSKNYVENHDGVKSAFIDSELYFDVNFDVVLKIILKELLEEAHNDIKEDFCKFESLSICYGKIADILGIEGVDDYWLLGYYSPEDNLIIIDHDAIYELYLSLMLYYKNEDIYISLSSVLSEVLSHEINHTRQNACDCRINAGQEYSNIDYSEAVSFLTESSAESDLYNSNRFISYLISKKDNMMFSYSDERRYEALVYLMGVMNNSLDDYYNAIFDSNINSLFKFLGAHTDEEKAKIYRIIYAIDGRSYRNDLIFNFVEDEYIYYFNETDAIGREFYYEIMNKFTIDLIEYINDHDDFTIMEAMCLFNVAQSVCLEDMKYLMWSRDTQKYDYYYDVEVINKINDTRTKFYEFLKAYYGVDNEELLQIVNEADFVMFDAECYIDNQYYETIDQSTYNYFIRLFEKFPLLKSIMFSTDADYFTYESVYKANNIELILK